MAKLTSPYGTIYRYDWKGNYIDEWASTGEIKRKLGFENELIGWTLRGKNGRKTAYGYQWKTFKADKIPPASTTTTGKVILCINTKDIFPSALEASLWAGLKSKTNILNSCNSYGTGNHSSAGKDLEGNKLYWKFLEDRDMYNS